MIGVPELRLSAPYEVLYVDPKNRIVEMRKLYKTHTFVEAYTNAGGSGKSVSYVRGYIDEEPEECSGVWGYEGDSIAIRIMGNYYPSTNVRKVK
jgi:hypothetical protein